MKIIFCSLIVLILVSCSGQAPQAIPTALPTATRDVNPSATATRLSPSKTPAPTTLSTNTPVALQSTYTLPAWMSDPDSSILEALVINEPEYTRKISFFNAATGQNYEISMPQNMRGYFWYDNTNFGLLSQDLKTAYRINLQTGKVSTKSVSSQATQFLIGQYEYDDYESSYGIPPASALEITKDPATNGILFRRARYGKYSNRSRNGIFSADWNENRTGIMVTNNETNQTIWQSEPFQDTYGTSFRWSPTDESHLAYLQGKPADPLGDFMTDSITLTIVDISSRKVLGNYAGNFGIMAWSPDGKKILYEDPLSIYSNYGIPFTDAPCILFLNLGETRCLRSIPRLVPEGYQLETTGVYKWAPDNNSIFYTYIYAKQNNRLGNLCIYSLLTSYINCPTNNLDVLNGMTIVGHDMSPDQQFIHFCYSASSILNDYADTAYDGVIKADGTGFFSWVGLVQIDGPRTCSPGRLWRPTP